VEPEEGKEMLVEIHQGECGHHASSRALVAKVFRHGFYWPTALENDEDLVRKCNGCQRYAKQNHTPAFGLKTIPLTWPFAVWCLDMVGPFKTARSSMTHILVMVDKFTMWLEVKPIAKCDGRTTVKFLKMSFCGMDTRTASSLITEPTLLKVSSKGFVRTRTYGWICAQWHTHKAMAK
jgi:hypothetical protein